MNDKNQIMFLDRLSQPIEFKGMDIGRKMFPSDVDAIIEFKNKCYILYEVKYNGKDMSMGQRIMLERITSDLGRLKPCLTLLVGHNISDVKTPVNLANTTVRALYSSTERKWRKTRPENRNTKDVTMEFLNWIDRGRKIG